MSKHTPGPWAAYFDETCGALGPDKGRVAMCTNLKGAHGLAGRRAGEEVEANARLIAAAPDLLAALKEIVDQTDGRNSLHIGQDRAYSIARAAIAKAEGGQA